MGALAWVVIHIGPAFLWHAMRAAGWGFAAACTIHFGMTVCDTLLLRWSAGEAARGKPFLAFLRIQLCGHAINGALPGLGEASKYALLDELLTPEARLAALVRQNVFMVLASLILVGVIPPIAAIVLGLAGAPLVGVFVLCGAFLIAAVLLAIFLRVGAGELPFRVLRRVRVPAQRVEAWRVKWQSVERLRRSEAGARRRAWASFGIIMLGRTGLVLENWVILHALHQPGFLLAAVSAAGEQLVAWATQFVPFQAATAEGGAYYLFAAVGRTPAMGVALELVRKSRRVVFLAVATVIIAIRQARTPAPAPASDPLAPPTAAP